MEPKTKVEIIYENTEYGNPKKHEGRLGIIKILAQFCFPNV